MSRLRLLLLSAFMALVLSAPLAVPAAHAASATDAQNPELTVALTVPDQAAVGETVATTITISNNSSRFQNIVVKGSWLDPIGEETVRSTSGLLFPGQTVTRVLEYQIDARSLPGTHLITLSVEARGGASTASAAVEVI